MNKLIFDEISALISSKINGAHIKDAHLLRNFVDFYREEIELRIKVFVLIEGLSELFVRELALHLHEQAQHLIVAVTRKHDASRVELVDAHCRTPHIDRVIKRQSEYCKI